MATEVFNADLVKGDLETIQGCFETLAGHIDDANGYIYEGLSSPDQAMYGDAASKILATWDENCSSLTDFIGIFDDWSSMVVAIANQYGELQSGTAKVDIEDANKSKDVINNNNLRTTGIKTEKGTQSYNSKETIEQRSSSKIDKKGFTYEESVELVDGKIRTTQNYDSEEGDFKIIKEGNKTEYYIGDQKIENRDEWYNALAEAGGVAVINGIAVAAEKINNENEELKKELGLTESDEESKEGSAEESDEGSKEGSAEEPTETTSVDVASASVSNNENGVDINKCYATQSDGIMTITDASGQEITDADTIAAVLAKNGIASSDIYTLSDGREVTGGNGITIVKRNKDNQIQSERVYSKSGALATERTFTNGKKDQVIHYDARNWSKFDKAGNYTTYAGIDPSDTSRVIRQVFNDKNRVEYSYNKNGTCSYVYKNSKGNVIHSGIVDWVNNKYSYNEGNTTYTGSISSINDPNYREVQQRFKNDYIA